MAFQKILCQTMVGNLLANIGKLPSKNIKFKFPTQVFTTSQSNPAEYVMKELGRMFRTYCHQKHSSWPQYVPYIEWKLDNVQHESTHQLPLHSFFKI